MRRITKTNGAQSVANDEENAFVETPRGREPQWRVREFIDEIGGAYALCQIISEAGYQPPPIMTVLGWRFRESIPSKWLLVLFVAAMRKNKLKAMLLQLTPVEHR